MDAAEKIVGEKNIDRNQLPSTGSEDFADMLRYVKGAYSSLAILGKRLFIVLTLLSIRAFFQLGRQS